jgi:hypothetical protein
MHGVHIAGIRDADGAHVSVSGPVLPFGALRERRY